MMTLRPEMEEKFEIAVEWHGSVLCVVLAGRLDAKTCDRFTQETDVAISEAELLSDAVILDCSALGVYQWVWLASRPVSRCQAA